MAIFMFPQISLEYNEAALLSRCPKQTRVTQQTSSALVALRSRHEHFGGCQADERGLGTTEEWQCLPPPHS